MTSNKADRPVNSKSPWTNEKRTEGPKDVLLTLDAYRLLGWSLLYSNIKGGKQSSDPVKGSLFMPQESLAHFTL